MGDLEAPTDLTLGPGRAVYLDAGRTVPFTLTDRDLEQFGNPMACPDDPQRFTRDDLAVALVDARYSKNAFISLINTLLVKAQEAYALGYRDGLTKSAAKPTVAATEHLTRRFGDTV